MNNYCIVTTINHPTKAIEKLHELFGKNLIVVGDKKTPADWNYKDVQYILDLPVEKQWYEGYAPMNHYARKNLGYLEAIKRGADVIYDTDDDNIPNINWEIRDVLTNAESSILDGWLNAIVFEKSMPCWFNVYKCFTGNKIWPRGFSLRHLTSLGMSHGSGIKRSSIQQGLADGEPDVDAIYRLTEPGITFFGKTKSVYLNRNAWCPFNSQSTWFFPKAYPLMYLPVHASFRMTDIWRSFVGQRCLWEIGEGVTFHSPSEVYQDRNEHDLLKDFEDEIPGYLKNDLIVETLSALKLKQGEENICENLLTCYQAIVDKGILPEMEIRSLKAWIRDYENATGNL